MLCSMVSRVALKVVFDTQTDKHLKPNPHRTQDVTRMQILAFFL